MMGELGRVAGGEVLGQLRIGQSMSQIVGFLPSAISPVAISVLSEAHATDKKDFQRLRSLHLRGNWLLAIIIVFLINLSSPFLINVLFGSEYKAALPLVIGMNWVALLTVVVENFNLYSLSAGNTKAIAVGSLIQKITFVGLTFQLIPYLKGTGYIFGLLAGGLLQFVIMLFSLWSNLEQLLKKQILFLILWSLAIIGIINLFSFVQINLLMIVPELLICLVLSSTFSILAIWSIFEGREYKAVINLSKIKLSQIINLTK
jgi:O-antigen/teichoic acid export membrane protein